MTDHPLIELSRSRDVTGYGIAVEDYTDHPTLCRQGVWVGTRTFFIERVVLSYEHEPDPLNVFWSLQKGADILYPVPGFMPGGPVVNAPGVHYVWPVDGLRHRIAFVSAPGTKTVHVAAQVLFQREGDDRIFEGPELTVEISGEEVTWPARQIAEEQSCRNHWKDLLSRYVRWHDPLPGETVTWLDEIHSPAARQVIAMVEELDRLDPSTDGELAAALRADLTRTVLQAQYRARRRN